jgi:alpha-D-ribose 1-methylphosphonate 5-triphosphate diphosphatase
MWLSNLRLVLADRVIERGSLRIEAGQIAEIVTEPMQPINGDAWNLEGMTVVPGIIDLHGDMLERDIEPRPGARFPIALALFELDKRLAGTGVTTAYAAVSFSWTEKDLRSQEKATEIIRTIQQYRPELLVDMHVHARFEINNPSTGSVLKPLLESGLIDLVSVMDHTPGQGQYKNISKYVDFMTKWLGFDPVQLGVDITDRIKGAIETKAQAPADWSIAEDVAQLALQHGIKVASHDDDTLAKIERMDKMGVSISEFPVTLEAAHAARERGMHVIMGAPNAYRGKSTSDGNLSARDAIRAGVVDILATDYFPAAPLQTAFLLADEGELSLPAAFNLVTKHPAEAMGLTDRGEIAVGKRADLVIVEPGVHHRIRATFRQGRMIYSDVTLGQLSPMA